MLGLTKLVYSSLCFSKARVMSFSSSLERKSLLTNFSTYEKEINISIGRGNRQHFTPTIIKKDVSKWDFFRDIRNLT